VIAALLGAGLEPRRVEACIRLGHGEAGLVLSCDERRQHAPLLLLGAEHDDRVQPEDVHMDRRGAAHRGAGFGDRLHHEGGLQDAEPGSAIGLRHGDAEPSILGERRVELMRKARLPLMLEPIGIAEAGAELLHRGAHRLLLGRKGEIHHETCVVGARRARLGAFSTIQALGGKALSRRSCELACQAKSPTGSCSAQICGRIRFREGRLRGLAR